jgi:hypothetical protein
MSIDTFFSHFIIFNLLENSIQTDQILILVMQITFILIEIFELYININF